MPTPAPPQIRLRGVRQNNLKNLDLDLPLGKLIVVTGLSGAGKSSLVFETLHAEGQRRYVETFSPYARQFMDMLDRPQVDSIENIRPSIAIEQSNTVRTSRSTVGTMTELTDYAKVWFSHIAELFDPETGEKVEDDNPATMWDKIGRDHPGKRLLICFRVVRPGKLKWSEILESLSTQGYTRMVAAGTAVRIEELDPNQLPEDGVLFVIQDRVKIVPNQRTRFIEAAQTALHFGQGALQLLSDQGADTLAHYSEGLHSPGSDRRFAPASPNLFSFNSPLGACEKCRGFGRVIELDLRLAIPDESLALADGAIRAFSGAVYSESQRDLLRACKKHGIPTDLPFHDLSAAHQRFVVEGEPEDGRSPDREWPKAWYGVRRFFKWLESNTYKMHVRVFLSKYRAYVECPDCGGSRLKPAGLNWKWRGHTLPDLYNLPVSELLTLLESDASETDPGAGDDHGLQLAIEAMRSRLRYLAQVGLGYLTLNRSSRTLSGGETQRVNLTTCLGTALVDTLFVLDEPSVGLHARDIDRLIGILRRLTAAGNTVVVVEHDEAVMRAADHLLEIGPRPGVEGGRVTFQGSLPELLARPDSITGAFLDGREQIPAPTDRRPITPRGKHGWLRFQGVSLHNLVNLDIKVPLRRFVALSGVSGSGKSTLMEHVLHQGLLAKAGKPADNPARIRRMDTPDDLGEIVMVDQSPASRTPRSTPVLFVDAWDSIRTLFAQTEAAQAAGLTAAQFSFNSGHGRCDHCQGLGHERIEMQFMADVYVTCPICEGKRFLPEVLEIQWQGKHLADILALTVGEAVEFFAGQHKIHQALKPLIDVGLDYLPLGQPLNTLSGGESQRLKLVKYLGKFSTDHANALLLLDEPTTGLHRHDIRRLLKVLHHLVDAGHSLVVIEHQIDVLKCADWIIELGPGAGSEGGRISFAGTPEALCDAETETARFLRPELIADPSVGVPLLAAEEATPYSTGGYKHALHVIGARQHNLRNLEVEIPHGEWTVVTGVSGSGKSSLAFDIIFAEGQRRFMESMSPWARQYVEQLPRPDLDQLTGIAPTVAIEQRVTRGSRKSTVATITEVAQYLRLLFARIGEQHSPKTGEPLIALSRTALEHRLKENLIELADQKHRVAYLCAPLIRGRKGHHQPIADWAGRQGYGQLRCDGQLVAVKKFKRLDRYREHDVELVVGHVLLPEKPEANLKAFIQESITPLNTLLAEGLRIGKGAAFLADAEGKLLAWYSTKRTDPTTGESFPELDPKHFSWNSARGWCRACRGHGHLYSWMLEDEKFEDVPLDFNDGTICPRCEGTRLAPQARAVYVKTRDKKRFNLPELLALAPSALLAVLGQLKLDRRGQAVLRDLRPEIEERLKFMDEVGLNYLTLDRSTSTLSGGEAQRIRLAAQLGSNLSGVLYVLDEPSIGLHARDNDRLLGSLRELKAKGNTLLVVEHDPDTMRHADRIIDLGPGAGIHGGYILANGKVEDLIANEQSLTGRYLKSGLTHPQRGHYRELPPAYRPKRKGAEQDWLVLKDPLLRNLKGGTLKIPKGRLSVVCGISGAGKSTLIRDLLIPVVERAVRLKKATLSGREWPGLPFGELRHGQEFRTVIEVDQSPIGKTLRSTPATYIGAFDLIRQFFGQIPEAKMRGFNPSTFSFNTKHGRCETCKGAGQVKLEMSFMPDAYVKCDTCDGQRYGPELLDLRWNGKNIADVLAMGFEEAAEFFHFHARLQQMMALMVETGLGYVELGQRSPTLSGGEAQRLKLVSELTKGLPSYGDRKRGIIAKNLYVLEEPTIGLHLADCERLIELLHRLVDQGHTVVVIEHHLDVIAEADYLIEVGPEGGDAGGELLYQGDVKGLLKRRSSPTAPFLKKLLKP